MELFSEIYSAYFRAVERVLRRAQSEPLTSGEIQKILSESTFSESAISILPKLQSGGWPLLRKTDGGYVSALPGLPETPMTALQKSWLLAVLGDPRVRLFLDDEETDRIREALSGTEPLYRQEDFHIFDRALDGDNYENPDYREHFRVILSAIRDKAALSIHYEGGKGGRVNSVFRPYRLEYSPKDDKFRAHCNRIAGGSRAMYTLNLARIVSASPVEDAPGKNGKITYRKPHLPIREVVIEITKERNALERCMVHFAHFEKRTEYDEATDRYTCTIRYNMMDETEVVIRVLSFGPTIRVLGPEGFVAEVRERVKRQAELIAESGGLGTEDV